MKIKFGKYNYACLDEYDPRCYRCNGEPAVRVDNGGDYYWLSSCRCVPSKKPYLKFTCYDDTDCVTYGRLEDIRGELNYCNIQIVYAPPACSCIDNIKDFANVCSSSSVTSMLAFGYTRSILESESSASIMKDVTLCLQTYTDYMTNCYTWNPNTDYYTSCTTAWGIATAETHTHALSCCSWKHLYGSDDYGSARNNLAKIGSRRFVWARLHSIKEGCCGYILPKYSVVFARTKLDTTFNSDTPGWYNYAYKTDCWVDGHCTYTEDDLRLNNDAHTYMYFNCYKAQASGCMSIPFTFCTASAYTRISYCCVYGAPINSFCYCVPVACNECAYHCHKINHLKLCAKDIECIKDREVQIYSKMLDADTYPVDLPVSSILFVEPNTCSGCLPTGWEFMCLCENENCSILGNTNYNGPVYARFHSCTYYVDTFDCISYSTNYMYYGSCCMYNNNCYSHKHCWEVTMELSSCCYSTYNSDDSAGVYSRIVKCPIIKCL